MSDSPERVEANAAYLAKKGHPEPAFMLQRYAALLRSVPNAGTMPDANYDLEVAAFAFAHSGDVPPDAQMFIRDLWRAYCKAEARSTPTRSTEQEDQ